MIGKHLKQFTNSGINGSALCLLARPMQSHAGQKPFSTFRRKKEKNVKKSSCYFPHCYKLVPKVGEELSRKPYSIAVRKGSTLKDQLNSM